MGAFIEYLFGLLKQFFGGIWRAISNFFLGIFDMINIGGYLNTLDTYKGGFTAFEWILAVLSFLIILAIIAAAVVVVSGILLCVVCTWMVVGRLITVNKDEL